MIGLYAHVSTRDKGQSAEVQLRRLRPNILVAFAEIERDLTRERIKDGHDVARAKGKKIGRHPKDCQCEIYRGRAE